MPSGLHHRNIYSDFCFSLSSVKIAPSTTNKHYRNKISLGRSAASTAYGNLSKTNIVFTLICIRSKDFFFLSHRQYPKFLESSETPVTPCRVLISSHLSTLIFLKSCFSTLQNYLEMEEMPVVSKRAKVNYNVFNSA